MPIWEPPASAEAAAKAALKALRGGTQEPRGIDALFKQPLSSPWSQDKRGAVLCVLLLGVTVVLVSARRRRRTGILVSSSGSGLTVTINLAEPSQLSQLPEEWKQIFREAGVTQARMHRAAARIYRAAASRTQGCHLHTMRLHCLLLLLCSTHDDPGGHTGGPAGPGDGAADRRDAHGRRVQATPRRGTRAACGVASDRARRAGGWRRWRTRR